MPNFTQAKWKRIVEEFFRKYRSLADWHERSIRETWQNNGVLRLFSGRKFVIHKEPNKRGEMVYPPTMIKNYRVQGCAGGDILPLMVVVIRRGMKKYKLKSKMILTVHDSIVFDYVESELEMLTKLCMQVTTDLPMYIKALWGFDWTCKMDGEAEIGPNYGDLHTYADTIKGFV